jgi:hypothetical protein
LLYGSLKVKGKKEKIMRKIKNFILKAIAGIVLFSLVFLTASPAFAASPKFNNHSKDKETLRLGNLTKGDTAWKDPISAEAGDRIAFNVYYHNTVLDTTAKNTKIRLDFIDNHAKKLTFKAYLWADNASYISNSGVVNTPCSGLNFVFEDTAKWYPNQTTSNPKEVKVQFVQSNSILVDIGDVPGGWASQGQLVLYGKISKFNPKFNYMKEDQKTLTLANVTQGGGAIWQSAVPAAGGDTIAFNVYYHNGVVCSTAKNTKISVELPEGAGNKIVSVAKVWADNANAVYGEGTINVSGMPEQLTFKTTALWYPNGSTQGQSIPVVISGNTATVEIGSIEGCWEYRGRVVFEGELSETPEPEPTPTPTPTPTTPVEETPKGEVLGAYTEQELAKVPVTGASSALALTFVSSILGYGAVARKKIKERLLGSKLSKAVDTAKKKKGL